MTNPTDPIQFAGDEPEALAWALITNGKPKAPRIRSLSWEEPSKESLEIAVIEGESWVPLYMGDPL